MRDLGFMKKTDVFLCGVFKNFGYAAGLIGALMMILSVINVIMRSMFTAPIYGTVEIVSYGGLLLGAFALAQNEIDDGNITMTLLTDSMKPVTKNVCGMLTSFLCAVFYGLIAYKYFDEITVSAEKASETTTLAIPFYIINVMMFLGFLAATVAFLLKYLRCIVFLVGRKVAKEVSRHESN
jgi:TRAP-type C4-dicarboxylate transport system permease small subunit